MDPPASSGGSGRPASSPDGNPPALHFLGLSHFSRAGKKCDMITTLKKNAEGFLDLVPRTPESRHRCQVCGSYFYAVKRSGVSTCSPRCRQRKRRRARDAQK